MYPFYSLREVGDWHQCTLCKPKHTMAVPPRCPFVYRRGKKCGNFEGTGSFFSDMSRCKHLPFNYVVRFREWDLSIGTYNCIDIHGSTENVRTLL